MNYHKKGKASRALQEIMSDESVDWLKVFDDVREYRREQNIDEILWHAAIALVSLPLALLALMFVLGV